jgi:hypothetical protein
VCSLGEHALLSRKMQEYILAWVGAASGVVGVVLGLVAIIHPTGFPVSPGVLALASAAAFVAAAAITGFWRWIHMIGARPDVEVDHIDIALTIHDKGAKKASLVRTQVDRANRKVFAHPFTVGGVAATGSIPEIRVDGVPVPKTDWELHVNEWSVTKVRQVVLNPGQTIPRSFEMDLIDSFPNATESLVHSVSYEMKQLTLKVKFPKDRYPHKLRTLMAQGNVTRDQLPDPVLEGDDFYTSVIPAPKLGAEYRIEWDW